MNFWSWLVMCIAFFPVAVIALIVFLLILTVGLTMIRTKMSAFLYRLEAKQHNKSALRLRLAKNEWMGIPLPTGNSGELRLTERLLTQHPFSFRQLEKVMIDRARDLEVDISIERDILSYDYVVKWQKHKKRKTNKKEEHDS
jgi:hypothetical protein